MAKKQALSLARTRANAQEFVAEWLHVNVVTPEGVELDEDQFGALMDTVTRGLVQAYVKGAADTADGKNN